MKLAVIIIDSIIVGLTAIVITIAMDHRIHVRMQYEQQVDYYSDYFVVVAAAGSYQNVIGNCLKHSAIAVVIANKLIDIAMLIGFKLADIRID